MGPKDSDVPRKNVSGRGTELLSVMRYNLVECVGYYSGHQLEQGADGEWVRVSDVLAALGEVPDLKNDILVAINEALETATGGQWSIARSTEDGEDAYTAVKLPTVKPL